MNAFTPALSSFNPHLASAWRISCQEVAEAIRFIRQYRLVIAEEGETLSSGHLVHGAGYVAFCRRALPETVERYREQLRRVSEAEAEMDRIGMEFSRSSDTWEN